MNELPSGYEVPVFKALYEPVHIAGVPRGFALVLWLGVGLAIAQGGFVRMWWTLPFAALCHVGAAWGTAKDPDFLRVLQRRLKSPRKLHP